MLRNYTVRVVNYASGKLIREAAVRCHDETEAFDMVSPTLNRWESIHGAQVVGG